MSAVIPVKKIEKLIRVKKMAPSFRSAPIGVLQLVLESVFKLSFS